MNIVSSEDGVHGPDEGDPFSMRIGTAEDECHGPIATRSQSLTPAVASVSGDDAVIEIVPSDGADVTIAGRPWRVHVPFASRELIVQTDDDVYLRWLHLVAYRMAE